LSVDRSTPSITTPDFKKTNWNEKELKDTIDALVGNKRLETTHPKLEDNVKENSLMVIAHSLWESGR
jgi:hypothetical protein